MSRQFVTPHGIRALLQFIEANQDKRLVFEVREAGRKRSVEQNARYWAILSDIAEQAIDETGKRYSPETWHEYMKAKFLGKDTVLIDGEPILIPKTTTKLRVVEFMDYCQQIEAWAVDHGVKFWLDERRTA